MKVNLWGYKEPRIRQSKGNGADLVVIGRVYSAMQRRDAATGWRPLIGSELGNIGLTCFRFLHLGKLGDVSEATRPFS